LDLKKIIAKLPTGYVDDSARMNGDQLRAEIIRAEASLLEVDAAQKADEKLAGAREIVKDIVSGYNDAKKAQRAKIAYSLHLLEERGELGLIDLGLEESGIETVKKRAKDVKASTPAVVGKSEGKIRAA